jgi:hypothetical protein
VDTELYFKFAAAERAAWLEQMVDADTVTKKSWAANSAEAVSIIADHLRLFGETWYVLERANGFTEGDALASACGKIAEVLDRLKSRAITDLQQFHLELGDDRD